MPIPVVVPAAVGVALAWVSRLMMIKLAVWVIGAMAYVGLYLGTQTFLVEPIIDQITTLATGTFTGQIAEWAAFLNIDRAFTMILSAYTAAGAVMATKVALFRR